MAPSKAPKAQVPKTLMKAVRPNGKVMVTLWLPAAIYRAIKTEAATRSISMSDFVLEAIQGRTTWHEHPDPPKAPATPAPIGSMGGPARAAR